MQERSLTEKQKLGRTLFLALFSQCPGAILQTFAVAHLLPLIHIAVTALALALATVSRTMAVPYFNFSKAASPLHPSGNILPCNVHIPFWRCSCCYRGGLVPPCQGHNLPIHTVYLWVHPSSSPAATSSHKHLGWWAPLGILKQMAAPV